MNSIITLAKAILFPDNNSDTFKDDTIFQRVRCALFGRGQTLKVLNTYGISIRPPDGAFGVAVAANNYGDNIFVVVDRPDLRFRGLASGEIQVGNYVTKDYIYFKEDGTVGIKTAGSGSTNIGDGGFADYVKISATGDTTFVGGAGLVYGSMYNHNTTTPVSIGTSGVAVKVPAGFLVGQTHNTIFQNASEIVVGSAGKYLITWQISFTAGGSNLEVEGGVMVDSVLSTEATAHRKIGTGTDTGSMSGSCILDLSPNAVVALAVTNETSTKTVNVEHANMTITQVGG